MFREYRSKGKRKIESRLGGKLMWKGAAANRTEKIKNKKITESVHDFLSHRLSILIFIEENTISLVFHRMQHASFSLYIPSSCFVLKKVKPNLNFAKKGKVIMSQFCQSVAMRFLSNDGTQTTVKQTDRRTDRHGMPPKGQTKCVVAC